MKKKIGVFLIIIVCILLTSCGNSEVVNEVAKENNQEILLKAEKLKDSYFIDEAISILEESNQDNKDSEIQNKIDEYKNYKNSFVKYSGDVEHIFFHSLIVYPQLAFDDKGHPASGYNTWFVTVDEFKKMLPQLKERGYVLVGINDVNYYDYMKPDGFAEKLVVDDNNEVSTLVKNMEGKEEITRDGDLVPILDDFIKDNPGFSYKGAKGTLAVTGYEGALGYRLDSESSKEEAKKTAKALKADGWTFASHSFTHNGDGYFQGVQNYDNLQYDFNKWNELIKPILGETYIYISPFGAMLEGSNINLVPENGFDIYCNVSRFPENEYSGNLIITPRYNIDGYTLFNCKDSLNKLFFNADEVMTPGVRPNTLE